MKVLLISLVLVSQIQAYGGLLTGCDSRCSMVFSKKPDCFMTAVSYHTSVLFGTMRNYVSAQINLQNMPSNKVPLPSDQLKSQLVGDTVATIKKEEPTDQSDQGDVLSASQAEPVVDALVDNVLADISDQTSKVYWPIYCPLGCEVSSSLFKILTIASLGLNGLLFLLGGASVVLNYWKDVKYARKKKDLTAKVEVTANGQAN